MQNSTSTKSKRGSISTPECECDPCKAVRRLEGAFRISTVLLGIAAFTTGYTFVSFLMSTLLTPLSGYIQGLAIGTTVSVCATWFVYDRWNAMKQALIAVMRAKSQHMIDLLAKRATK